MGVVVQSLKHIEANAGKIDASVLNQAGLNGHRAIISESDKLKKLAKNSAGNLNAGSKKCPILNEVRNVGDGVAQSKYSQLALDAGLLSFYAIPGMAVGASKGIKSGIITAQ